MRFLSREPAWTCRAVLAVATLALALPAAAQQPITTTRIASGFDRPVAIVPVPGDDSMLFIVEQKLGVIEILRDGAALATPFLDVSAKVEFNGNERGLCGMAFHPDYVNNGFFYIHYTEQGTGDVIIERYSVSSGDPEIADPTSGVVILGPIPEPDPLHNGGSLHFGPLDGKLYIALGDGGGHPNVGNAQDPQSLLGKILRLDVDIPSPHIPPDNPFVGDASTLDEIWALGLRNPWRFSFDSKTGDIYVGEVGGPENKEEIEFQPASSLGGENYGWPCMEGTICGLFGGCTCFDPGQTLPIKQYAHSNGNCAVIGGFVYRGCAISGLSGTYFYGDFCNARIWSFQHDGVTSLPPAEFVERTAELQPGGGFTINNIVTFGQDNQGEIYIGDFDGDIFKIVPDGGSGEAYCTGKTSSLGCVPFVTTVGVATVTGTNPFNVRGMDMLPGQAAVLLYGYKKSALPFLGGTLCVKGGGARLAPPKIALPNGPLPCQGIVRRNFVNRILSGRDLQLTAGQSVTAQWLQRDPADPTGHGVSLTNAVRFVICP